MNEVTKIGIGLLVAGLVIYLYFGVNPGDFLNSPPVDQPIPLQDSLSWVGGATSDALMIIGTIMLIIGFGSSRNKNSD